MPPGGINALDVKTDREWIAAKGAHVLYLDGEESPNAHPLIDQSKVKSPSDYPFPYMSNPYTCREMAKDCGDGDIEAGKMTALLEVCQRILAPE